MKIKETSDGIILEVFVKTEAKNCKIEITDEEVIFLSKKRPHKGIVNKELIKMFSSFFGSKVKIVSGLTSNQKILLIKGLNKLDFEQKINDNQ
ncbi:MAG: DUF167 domain-containing protein [Candidatus Lokiarchaeota archaeon]|nr:DUF167 domain-containing protein [Candidatus Lokiarchaeota archaeon]